jgi:hypothetical protein
LLASVFAVAYVLAAFVTSTLVAALAVVACDPTAQRKPNGIREELTKEAAALDARDIAAITQWMDRHGMSPIDYLVSKSKKHQVVILGEYHEVKQNLQFVKAALPILYEKAGVTTIGLEVCNAEINSKLERLVSASYYQESLAVDIARSQNWHIWGSKEYWDLLREVWKLNQSLRPDQPKMRVVGIDREMDLVSIFMLKKGLLKNPDKVAELKEKVPFIIKRDLLMAEQVETEIIKKETRGIVLVGNMHAFTHYLPPIVKDQKYVSDREPRMGYILRERHGDRVFQITLHLEPSSPAFYDPTYNGKEPVLIDVIEGIMNRRGNAPIGFDLFNSPLATIRDSYTYYFHYQPAVVLGDICRGYIFLAPWENLRQCEWIDGFVSEEMFLELRDFLQAKYKRDFSSASEFNSFQEGMAGTPISFGVLDD